MLDSVCGAIAELVPLAWFVLVSVLLIVFRKKLGSAADALVDRLHANAPFKAGALEVGSAPEPTEATLPTSSATAPNEAPDEEQAPEDGSTPTAASLGGFAAHFSKRTAITVGPSPFQHLGESRPGRNVAIWDAQGMAQVNAVLAVHARGRTVLAVAVGTSEARSYIGEYDSIVAVGGPLTNPTTEELLRSVGCRFRFEQGGLTDVDTGERYDEGGYAEALEGIPGNDAVLIVAGPHPSHQDGWFTVIAPVHGGGMVSAVNCLLEADPVTLAGAEWRKTGFQAVAYRRIKGGEPSSGITVCHPLLPLAHNS